MACLDAGGVFLHSVVPARSSAGVPGAPALGFHTTWPGYEPTPLVGLPAVARELGVGRVLLKDESSRLGLPAFKVLGASWAIARLVAERYDLRGAVRLESLRAAAAGARISLVTATDGNHGRAVARVARLLGLHCIIVVPQGVAREAVAAIAAEGARILPVSGDYDAAVARAATLGAEPGVELVQDTAWEGYTRVPGWIVEGYATMLAEIDDRVEPDLLVVPAGVGSLAQAVVARYRGRAQVATVEPEDADCVRRSLQAGHPVTVATGHTAMAGLNCPTVSRLAWPHLRDGVSAALAVTEAQTAAAVTELAEAGMPAGPCGAAALAGARLLPRQALGLTPDSTLVLLCTEGPDPNATPPR